MIWSIEKWILCHRFLYNCFAAFSDVGEQDGLFSYTLSKDAAVVLL